MGMRDGLGTASEWPKRAEEWLKNRGLLNASQNHRHQITIPGASAGTLEQTTEAKLSACRSYPKMKTHRPLLLVLFLVLVLVRPAHAAGEPVVPLWPAPPEK